MTDAARSGAWHAVFLDRDFTPYVCFPGVIDRSSSVVGRGCRTGCFSVTAEELRKDGNEAFKQNDFDAAIDLYSQSAALDPSNPVRPGWGCCWGDR